MIFVVKCMKYKETEIQEYIWEHREDFSSMIEEPVFEEEPNKCPWEFEPWELLYYQTLKEYKLSYGSLEGLEIFGCEVRLPKEGESTIRTDFLGCLEGENGFVICELKVNKEPERQTYTELFAYANHVRSKFAPMGRRDVFYLLIAPMEERIVREATISTLLYDKNRVLALIPEVGDTISSLKFKLWIPSKDEFRIFTKTAFAFENLDVFKISWRGAAGKWSPVKDGKKPNSKMIHRLNNVSHYAAQIMESYGINGFVYCSQAYPAVRDAGFYENGITICGVNPFKAAKTRFLLEAGCSLEDAAKMGVDVIEMVDIMPGLKNICKDPIGEDYCYWLSESWASCLDRIGLEVVKRVNYIFGPSTYLQGYGTFTWDSYLNNSSEDHLCWNYDICLTGIFRQLYDSKLERHYSAAKGYTKAQLRDVRERENLERHYIDMMYDHEHIREFIKSLIENEKPISNNDQGGII